MKLVQSPEKREFSSRWKFEVRRVNESILGASERRLLIAMAKRLPSWVTPDMLTAIGLLGGAITALGFVAINVSYNFVYVAALGLFIHWFGDSLDGTLARVRRIERPMYGFFIDNSADKASEIMIIFGLGLSPLMHLSAALMALLGIVLLRFYDLLQLPFSGVHQGSHLGCGGTETRILIIGLALFGPLSINIPSGSVTLFDIAGVCTFIVGLSYVAAAFFVDRSRFALLDPERAESNQSDVRPFSVFKLRDDAEPMPLGADRAPRRDSRLQDR